MGNCIEFIIPINDSFPSNQHYRYKAKFKLVNAVRARHYGSFLNIGDKVEELYAYIAARSLQAITQPYFIVRDIQNGIFDVYIGISENVL